MYQLEFHREFGLSADPITITAIAGLAVSAGAAAYGIKTQHDAAAEAKKAGKEQEARALALQAEARGKAESDDATQSAASARERQRLLAASATGRQSTILTSPLGVPGAPPTTQNRLLGG